MTPLERANEVEKVTTHNMKFVRGGYEITLRNPRVFRKYFATDLRVKKDGIVVFQDDVRIVNPPLLVSDPNGVIKRTSINRETKEVTDTFWRKDPKAAIKEVLKDIVLAAIK